MGVGSKERPVLLGNVQGNPLLVEIVQHIVGILSHQLYNAAETVSYQGLLLREEHVVRVAGERIHGDMADHGAKAEVGVDGLARLNHPGRGEEDMVQRLESDLRIVRLRYSYDKP